MPLGDSGESSFGIGPVASGTAASGADANVRAEEVYYDRRGARVAFGHGADAHAGRAQKTARQARQRVASRQIRNSKHDVDRLYFREIEIRNRPMQGDQAT